MSEMTDRELLLAFVGSLTLCDHMGDAADAVSRVLGELGVEHPQADDSDEWWPGLRRDLHALGVKTLYGTELWSQEDEDDYDDEGE